MPCLKNFLHKSDMLKIGAVVLAAGESKRMGFPKMLLPFRGKPIISVVLKTVIDSGIDYIIVVLGHRYEMLIPLIDPATADYCINHHYHEGMLSSVVCGIKRLRQQVDAIMIFPGDQPLISPELIQLLTDNYNKTDKEIIIPVYEGRRGHPILIGSSLMGEIEKLDPETGLRGLSLEYPYAVLEVNSNDPGIIKDFDTYEEYMHEINQTK
jgi:molybdenum cofactor cytidylyltransferase